MSRKVCLLLVMMSLLMSMALFYYVRKFENLNAQSEFNGITADGIASIQARLDSYSQVLTGIAAHISVSEEVSRRQYTDYTAGLDLGEQYPGLLAVNVITSAAAEDVPALEAELSREYGREIAVQPQTDTVEKMIVTRVAPEQGNEGVIGLDLSFESGRRMAMNRARATRAYALSSRILLVQDETRQPGFLMTRAVYERDAVVGTALMQEGAFLGWVAAPFIGASVFAGTTSQMEQNYNLVAFDADSPDPEATIFSSFTESDTAGHYERGYNLSLNGRLWHLKFSSTPAFDARFNSYLPLAAMAIGLALTALLSLTLKYHNLRSRALAQVAEKRARQLGASEEEKRGLLESTVLVVIVLDSQGRIVFANAAAERLFNREETDFMGRDFDDFVILKPGPSNKGYNAEGFSANGKTLLLDVETTGWTSADGEEQTTAILRDVTEQIEARREVETVRRRYDLALAGAEIGIFELDLETGKSIVSESWHKIMGTTDITGNFDSQSHFHERVHPDDLAHLREANRRCIEGETKRTIAQYRIRFGADWRWMRSDAVAVERDGSGRATRLVGAQTDITALRHARNALETSEARFRMVLEEAPVGMALIGSDGQIISANPALEKWSGYSAEMLRDRKGVGDLLDREDFNRMSADVRDIMIAGSRATYQNQFRIQTRSGEKRWGLFNVSWTYDKNAKENVYIAQIVDITDQKKLEQIKSEFVATVSHELRTPLTSIKGALGLLGATDAKTMSSGAQRLLEIARVNADRLTTIVNDILDLEKISSGEVVFEIGNESLNDIVQSSINEMLPFAVQHDNTLELAGTDDGIIVRIDAGRTKQVLANLISNACKYSDPDTPVTVRVERVGDAAIVFVQNFGPGVPESFRAQIFDAFTQADGSDTRSKGGTGLGLNITRQIVARQGGRMGFESTTGGLTVFWFTCPSVKVDALVTPRDNVRVLRALPARLSVLHVEDDYDFADVIKAGFGKTADIVHAGNLSRALAVMKSKRWDVVLVDWTLPDGNATSLLDVISRHQPQAKIIGLSAQNAPMNDPRVILTMTKSQVEIDAIVEQVTTIGAGGYAPVGKQR